MSPVFRSDTGKRGGVTLIELLVVMAILGAVTGLAGLAFRDARPSSSPAVELRERIAAARHEAITSGRSVTIAVLVDERPHAVTAFADGRVVTDLQPARDSAGLQGPTAINARAQP